MILAVAAGNSGAQPVANRPRQFSAGSLKRLDELPQGRLRNQMDRLRPAARERALEWLQRFHFTEDDLPSLQVDPDGAVFYADDFVTGPVPAEAETPEVSEAAVPVSPFPASLIFHSRPGAPNVVYLNFTGETVSGTAWNTSLGRSEVPAVAFSTDSDFSTFSDSEQLAIRRIWQRVAEDYAPFDVDVTTERPASFGSRVAHALVTRNTDANGDPNPSSTAGGVAYVNVFAGGSFSQYRPAWVYYNNLSSSESYIAEAVSHEIGHNMGLSHDGKTDGASYYNGHGSGEISWGPIMGTGYNRNVSQWSKGEYYLANNTQDDLSILSGKLTYRADDHGNTRGSASPLILSDGTNVVSTTPENDPTNSNPDNKGVLERNTDVDVFSFVTGSGQISLTVNPWVNGSGTRGGNLDILLELYDESGDLVLTNNSSTKTGASIQGALPEGLYFLYVRNTGTGNPLSSSPSGYTSYASLGQYFINGYVRPSGYIAPPMADLHVSDISEIGTGPIEFTVTYTDNLAVDVSTIDDNDVRVTGPNGFDSAAKLVSVDAGINGFTRVATYSVPPPSGEFWSHTNNGEYIVWLEDHQIGDTEGAWTAGQQLGSFNVNVPVLVYANNLDSADGWNFESQWQHGAPAYSSSGPSSGFTGSNIIGFNLSGNYPNNLSTVYATSPEFNTLNLTSLTLKFRRWLRVRNGDTANIQVSINGSDWTTVWSASQSVFDNSWHSVQYSLPESVAGKPSVRLRWGMGSTPSQNDIGWNFDDIEILGVAGSGATTLNYTLAASANNPAWGSVNPTNGTYAVGSQVQIVATPQPYFRFLNWTGDISGSNNPLSLTITTNLIVQAVFAETLTTNHPTPLWWLAEHGFSQNFESAVTNIGSNGMAVWESYIAGLNPNDPQSQLKLSLTAINGHDVALQWNAVTERVYTVLASPDLAGNFSPITNAANLPASISSITNSQNPFSPQMFYRLEVHKP